MHVIKLQNLISESCFREPRTNAQKNGMKKKTKKEMKLDIRIKQLKTEAKSLIAIKHLKNIVDLLNASEI